jgi:hypothetical protein
VPSKLSPQHCTVPPVTTAQVENQPTATTVTPVSPGITTGVGESVRVPFPS